jgi:hypothetical protein
MGGGKSYTTIGPIDQDEHVRGHLSGDDYDDAEDDDWEEIEKEGTASTPAAR